MRINDPFGKIWLGFSIVLIMLPWLAHALIVCTGRGLQCSLNHGPLVGLSIILGVLLALVYCKVKEVEGWFWYALLQCIGLLGLIGFQDFPFVVGPVYALLLIASLSYQNRGSKQLTTSPLYTVVFLIPLLLGAAGGGKVVSVIFPDVSSILVLFSTFVVSVLSLLWWNIWTKRYSFWVYLFVLICFVFMAIASKYVLYFTLWDLQTGGLFAT